MQGQLKVTDSYKYVLRLDHQGALHELSVETTTEIVEIGYRSNIRAN